MQVLRRKYGKEADIWSSGVILYILLCGVPPFFGETEQQIFDSVLKGHLDLTSDPWPRISSDAKDCVRRMLTQVRSHVSQAHSHVCHSACVPHQRRPCSGKGCIYTHTNRLSRLVQDPQKRATADEVLQHQWMKEHGTASSAPLDNVILRRMQGFSAMNKLKQQALYILAKNMAPAEVAGLHAIFQVLPCGTACNHTCEHNAKADAALGRWLLMSASWLLIPATCVSQAMDTDQNGTITIDELRRGLREQGSTVSEEELDTLVRPAADPAHGAAACLIDQPSDAHESRLAGRSFLPVRAGAATGCRQLR
jgi:calcium-dependent protein kinase